MSFYSREKSQCIAKACLRNEAGFLTLKLNIGYENDMSLETMVIVLYFLEKYNKLRAQ